MPTSARSHTAVRLTALVLALALLALLFSLVARPWYQTWGATTADLQRALPGDAIVAVAAVQETRAITINAPADRVWPWVAQLGQDRGGFYSFDLLENIAGCEMPVEDRLRPEKQSWRPGDRLWMYPPQKAGGLGYATLREHVPGRSLAFATYVPGTSTATTGGGSWSFVVEPAGSDSTRFLIRGRSEPGQSLAWTAFDRLFFEPAHFVMERRTMIGIKQLAEGDDRGRWLNHAQVALWTITFGLFVAAAVMVLRRSSYVRPLIGFLTAGIVFQILTFAQPALFTGLLLVVLTVAMLFPEIFRMGPRVIERGS